MRALLGIGVPGAGKTTILKPYAQAHGYTYISPDEIREELSGDAADQRVNREAWDEARRRVEQAFSEGKGVVIDATFAKQHERAEFVAFLREAGATDIVAAYAEVSLELAATRNRLRDRIVPEHALLRMHEALRKHPPSKEDGFDSIVSISTLSV